MNIGTPLPNCGLSKARFAVVLALAAGAATATAMTGTDHAPAFKTERRSRPRDTGEVEGAELMGDLSIHRGASTE